ncbi:hypothetical protein M8C21_020937 [Ambrosia artemisiifolia]|uniref:C2H2-type domain-containing protein n=1 Tax=Ambrosia artemisiifolia TaxID=4212 RepID=A0AAD5G633_AMBAR|nr:hypothetical protein M8C21_020937 [Ambrosia artemisiifolia]
MVDFENSSSTAMAVSAASTECSSGGNDNRNQPVPETQPVIKKKRNLPGMPDPDAEVIALSPTTLQATNRFVCEICNKGFQRDQNLQLHRRGHNLPWKLKQRDGKEIRKRVYVCPEKTCVHHDPLRALGDLTGIKKHFSRKHGEKKWKCERCSKKYAVQSDWKAHMKTCGTKEYRCDCGTLFSRRDSFITHRAFCDALAQESARSQTLNIQNSPNINSEQHTNVQEAEKMEAAVISPPSCSPPPPLTPSTGVLSPVQSVLSSDLPEKAMGMLQHQKVAVVEMEPVAETCLLSATTATTTTTVSGGSTTSGNNNSNNPSNNPTNSTGVFASIFASSSVPSSQSSSATYSICGVAGADRNTTMEPMSLSLSSSLYHSTTTTQSLFPPPDQALQHRQYLHAQQPALSATALLQKAAQMGATSSNTSFLHALGLTPTPSSASDHYHEPSIGQWSNIQSKQDRNDNSDHLMMGPPAPTTLDFLGLGTGSSSGYSAFLNTIGGSRLSVAGVQFGGLNAGVQNKDWDDSGDKKPTLL